MKIKYSIIIPVYKNAESIPLLIETLDKLNAQLSDNMEAVFVVDGSPDESFNLLKQASIDIGFPMQLIAHARNFGSFAAIRTGLESAQGDFFAMMAADLQEPPELMLDFFEYLESDQCDVAVGERIGREDGFFTNLSSKLFWGIYRKFVNSEIPEGGVDVFACNKEFREQLLRLKESRSSLVALVYWLGFRRKNVQYKRLLRLDGESSWSFSKKLEYMFDSIFSFTDLPIKVFTFLGFIGLFLSCLLGVFIFLARILGYIELPGYAPLMLAVLSLGSINLLGLGVVGNYAWRAYENSKSRPLAVVLSKHLTGHYS